ncbi:MAG: helix-turn-helix domain-containing protein [Candidatus Peregrinibacteria bacterium]
MQILQVLHDLGLQDKEPDVFLALLTTPGTQPASVIAKKMKLNRITVYKTLVKLAEMGLVTKTMKYGIICFFVEDPDKVLENLIKQRKDHVETLSKQVIGILPQIKTLQQQELYIPRVRFYEGVEGVKRVYEDTLVEKKPIDSFENVGDMAPEVHDYLMNEYVPRRVENGIFARIIAPKNPANKKFREKDKTNLRDTRFAALKTFPVEIELNIYGNKTAFFSYKTEEMFAVIIESRAIANSMRAIFESCWKVAK